jgi:prepilin-type N-terminal cleavage/methylation domain-containing protein
MGPVQGRAQALARSPGFTLVEVLVVTCVVALLFGVALDRLLRYQELAERTAVELNVAAMNVALTSKFSALLAGGRGELIAKEVGANPIDLLARPPENYLGERFAPPQPPTPRSWYFDRQAGDLVYVANRNRFLTVSGQAAESLRFGIVLPPAGARRDGLRELRQPWVQPRTPYSWVID